MVPDRSEYDLAICDQCPLSCWRWGSDDSGVRGIGGVIESDTFETEKGQASISGCFENEGGHVSGVVAYDSLLRSPGAA